MTIPKQRVRLTALSILALCSSACAEGGAQDVTLQYIQDPLTLNKDHHGPKLVIIPHGVGTIGGANFRSFKNEEPIHAININHNFALSVTEITFQQYDLYCKAAQAPCPDDKGWGRGEQPVINVSWEEANAYTQWLTAQTGHTYRLPSEAEWEYAARAGTASKFWWGDEYQQGKDHCDRDQGGCPAGTELSQPLPVARFQANPFGLYDVTSNVMEWVQDCGNDSHKRDPIDNSGAARTDGDCDYRMVKGSNWKNPQPYVHLSKRLDVERDYQSKQIGFRVLRELE